MLTSDIRPRFNPDPIVRKQVQAIIEPFDAGVVTMSVATTTLDPTIFVTCTTFEETFTMDGRELYAVGNDLTEMANYIGYRAGHYFASLREPVPSNVILSEN